MTSLGTLGGVNSEAFAINERGQIVGAANTAAGAVRAFLWQAGVMIDLNTLIPDGSGWVLVSARGISEGGQIVGTGTLNGVTRGFLLTPPIDLELRTGGVKSQSDSNLPRGVEVGKTIRFVFSAQALAMDGLTVYGARITDTLTGPAEYVSATTNGDATCTVTPKTVTCDLEAVDSIGLGREIMLTVRTTAPGAIAHTAVVSSSVPDPNAANDSVTEENRAVALATLALTPSSIPGGKASSARVTLTGQAPQSDAVVRLSSSRPDIAPVPATLIVPSWTNTRAFNIIPAVVAAATTVEISASYGLVTQQATLTVLPPALAQLYLTPTTIVGGCGTSAGKIVLTGAAPAGGAVIPVANTNGNALVPSSVTVAAGTTTKTFTVPTKTVTSPTVGSVTAAYGGVSQTLTVTVRPIRVKTLTFSPNPVKGGTAVTGTIVLECPAAPGAVVVTLTGGSATTAAPSVTSVTIPAGATTATFPVRTAAVSANTTVTIYATVFGVRKGAALTVTP